MWFSFYWLKPNDVAYVKDDASGVKVLVIFKPFIYKIELLKIHIIDLKL